MTLFDTTQIALERAMSGATLRHSVLASNLANANTPGYRPMDVDFHSALQEALQFGSRAIEAAEIAPAPSGDGVMRADGNGVDVDVTSAHLAENGLELSAITQVAGARLDVLRYALGTR
ncbi:MAG: flagellar basal body rod protein FlgB [Thermoleophilaceae bacterium]